MRFTFQNFLKNGNAMLFINLAVAASLIWAITLWAGQIISAKASSPPAYVPPKAGAAAANAPPADYSAIKLRNLFYPVAQKSAAAVLPGELPVSTLPFKLMGTIISPNAKECAAILESAAAKEQNIYRVDDALAQGTFITKISRFEAVISNNGHPERIPIYFGDAPAGAAQPGAALAGGTQVAMLGDNKVVMDKRFFDAQKSNMNDMMTQIRAVPNMADGAINGFQVFEIVKDSLYDKIGIKNQDVVQRINGQALTSMEGGLDLFNAIKNDNRFVIDVLRNNQTKTITVDIQ